MCDASPSKIIGLQVVVVMWGPVLLSGLLAFCISFGAGLFWFYCIRPSPLPSKLPSRIGHAAIADSPKRWQQHALKAVFCAMTMLLPVVMLRSVRDGWVAVSTHEHELAGEGLCEEGSSRTTTHLSPVSGLVVFVISTAGAFKAVQAITGTLTHGAAHHGAEFWLVYFCSPVEPVLTAAGDPVLNVPASLTLHLHGDCFGTAICNQ
jgi:hypothetical protein